MPNSEGFKFSDEERELFMEQADEPSEKANFIGSEEQMERFLSEVEKWAVVLQKPIESPRHLSSDVRQAIAKLERQIDQLGKAIDNLPTAAVQVINQDIETLRSLETEEFWEEEQERRWLEFESEDDCDPTIDQGKELHEHYEADFVEYSKPLSLSDFDYIRSAVNNLKRNAVTNIGGRPINRPARKFVFRTMLSYEQIFEKLPPKSHRSLYFEVLDTVLKRLDQPVDLKHLVLNCVKSLEKNDPSFYGGL